MSLEYEWATAFARQADADLTAWQLYEIYPEAVSTKCHRMQFLQMACEKLCKAYLLQTKTNTIHTVVKSHGFVKKNLSVILRQELSYKREHNVQVRRVQSRFNQLAQEIEVLSPSMDRDRRPDNCEYPWKSGEVVISPLDWHFELSNLLTIPSGTTFLKCLRSAIDRILVSSAA